MLRCFPDSRRDHKQRMSESQLWCNSSLGRTVPSEASVELGTMLRCGRCRTSSLGRASDHSHGATSRLSLTQDQPRPCPCHCLSSLFKTSWHGDLCSYLYPSGFWRIPIRKNECFRSLGVTQTAPFQIPGKEKH